MLELVATAWLYALLVMASLFVGVLVLQVVVRRARSLVRVVQRSARVAPLPARPAVQPGDARAA